MLVSAFAVPQAMALEITMLSGETHSAQRLTIDHNQLIIDDHTPLALSDVDRLRINPEAQPLAASSDRPGLRLKDGSWIPYSHLAAGDDRIIAKTPLGELTIPLGSVVAWGPYSWISQQRSQEQDIVQLASGDVRGTVLGLGDDQLRLQSSLSDSPLEIPFAEIAGLHLALPVDRPRGLHLATSLQAGREDVLLVGKDGAFYLQAQPKQAVSLDAINELRVHGGRRVFLPQLTPSQVKEEGAFGVVWNYARNQNIDGSPLVLGGKRYSRGLVIHSKAELTWQLNGEYLRLQAMVGISDIMGNQGDCEVGIYVDDELRWHREHVRGGKPPEEIAIDLRDAQQLRIMVDYGARYDIGDHLALAGAWLLKK